MIKSNKNNIIVIGFALVFLTNNIFAKLPQIEVTKEIKSEENANIKQLPNMSLQELSDKLINNLVGLEQSFQQQAYIKASNTNDTDIFGYSVAISGNTMVVGARQEDSNATGIGGDQGDNSSFNSGAVYVFIRTAGIWSFEAYLKASNTDAIDYFGSSVAISGDTIVVGAENEDSDTTGINGDQLSNSASESGAAYVFTRTDGIWTQQAYLKASNTDMDDNFGYTVAISDDTIVVGARHEESNAIGVNGDESNNSALESGAVYVFIRNTDLWSQEAYLKPLNTGSFDRFGSSLAISGDSIVVGAYHESSNAIGINGDGTDNSFSVSGAAYVFTRNASIWNQQAYIKASNTGINDEFGYSVAIANDTLVIGAKKESSSSTGVNGNELDDSLFQAGAAYVFTRIADVWTQQAYIKPSTIDFSDHFGHSVALSEDMMVVGANYEDSAATGINGNQIDNTKDFAGAVYRFIRTGDNWVQQEYIKASNTDFFFEFGVSVALSDDTLVVGAIGDTSISNIINVGEDDTSAFYAGSAYVFTDVLSDLIFENSFE